MLLAGLVAPYLIALAAFPLLVKRHAAGWGIPFSACISIYLSTWLVGDDPLQRFLASISCAIVSVKVVDAWLDATRRCAPTWREYVSFLANPFVYVRRCLPLEPRLSILQDLSRLLSGASTCAIGTTLFTMLFRVDWHRWPFLVEHSSKSLALMLSVVSGLTALAALWRLFGGTARDYMDKPFAARTPAEFWRRYNRNMQQFFWRDIFSSAGGRRSPVRTTLFVFAISALMHELIFFSAIGRVQGYQMAFFSIQGVAAALTVRVKPRGWVAIPWLAATLAFNLLSSVLFFASIHSVTPFYARGLPTWLHGW